MASSEGISPFKITRDGSIIDRASGKYLGNVQTGDGAWAGWWISTNLDGKQWVRPRRGHAAGDLYREAEHWGYVR